MRNPGKQTTIIIAVLAMFFAFVAPSAVADEQPVWQGGWASENGSFHARSSLGGWYQIQKGSTRVDELWKDGYWGQGIDVAVIDTGSLPVLGLANAGTVKDGLDISFDSQNPDVVHLDGYGHGVHMAGLIAGNTVDKTPRNTTFRDFTGMAPSARVVSVKVGASDGAVDLSQVIAAIDWVVQHRNDAGLNIRVLNLSFGFDSVQSAAVDPLSHAVENAWKAGIVVVAAAGNDGNAEPLRMPARNPFVIAVGSYDQQYNPGEGVISDFSNCGTNGRTVDVVAPGRSIVSLRAPGSYLDDTYPNARAGADFFKGSGSSQSAAIVSGGVAVLLSRYPTLTPDGVKNLLMDSAVPVAGAGTCDGAGAVDFEAAKSTPLDLTPQSWSDSEGTGSLEAARGSQHLELNGVVLAGEQDIFGADWNGAAWATASSSGTSWDGGTFNGLSWSGDSWAGLSWSGLSWSGLSWSGLSWSGLSWSGLSWSGKTWNGLSWSGLSWSSGTWSGLSWSGLSWSSLS